MGQDELLAEPTPPERSNYTGLLIGASTLPVFVLFWILGKEKMGLTLCLILIVAIFAVKFRWRLRKHVWFWAAVVVLLLLHMPLLILVHWPKGWTPAVVMIPFGYADYGIYIGVIALAEKVMIKPSPTETA